MKKSYRKSTTIGFVVLCLILPLIAFGIIYDHTYDLAYSTVASLLVASMPPLVRFIYVLNSDKKN